MMLEMLLDGHSVVKVDLNLPMLFQALQTSVRKEANARSTPATEAQMRDLLSRIDPRSAEYLKAIARNADGTMTWKDMRPIFGIEKAEDWPAYSGSFGKGITRAYRKILGDPTAKLVWWNDADWEDVDWDDEMCAVFVDGPALDALRAAAGGNTSAQIGETSMNVQQITQAIGRLDAQGHVRMWVALRDNTGVELPLGEDNAALTFQDKDGAVTFRIGGKPRTTAIRLEDIVAIRATREA